VADPLTGLSLVEAGMVGEVAGRFGLASVEIRLPVAVEHYPGWADLCREVESALVGGGFCVRARVRPAVMDDAEKAELVSVLQARGASEGRGGGAPFLRQDTRVVAVISGKGGVGKSTVALNLAAALARSHTVGLLDADVYGFSLAQMASAWPKPVPLGELLVPVPRGRLRVVSPGHFLPKDQPVLWRGPMLHKALAQLLSDVYWGFPDYLLIDTPPGTGDVLLSLAELLSAAQALVVTSPQETASTVALRSGLASSKLKLEVVGVVENMSYVLAPSGEKIAVFGEGGGQLIAECLSVPLLGRVPVLGEIGAATAQGYPVLERFPESGAAQIFLDIAAALEERLPRFRRRKELAVRAEAGG
jgi:ATP-binding protein involved in chromosome partitioning